MNSLNLINKAFFLKRTPIFASLNLDMLLTIADKLGALTIGPKETIFSLDEEANRMYFIVDGKVKINHTPDPTLYLGQGEFFGEEALFANKHRRYSAEAVVTTQLLTLSRTSLFTIISECPSVAMGFLQVYASATLFRPYNTEVPDQ